jgi:hypothetical protein
MGAQKFAYVSGVSPPVFAGVYSGLASTAAKLQLHAVLSRNSLNLPSCETLITRHMGSLWFSSVTARIRQVVFTAIARVRCCSG